MTAADFELVVGQQPNNRVPGLDPLLFEFLWRAPDSIKEAILACINSILTGEAPLVPPSVPAGHRV
jgi:hypothetical protein